MTNATCSSPLATCLGADDYHLTDRLSPIHEEQLRAVRARLAGGSVPYIPLARTPHAERLIVGWHARLVTPDAVCS